MALWASGEQGTVVTGNRRTVSAVTLIGIAIMKAPGASSFRAHTNPQEHCSPGGYNIAFFQVHSSDELHFSGSFGICHYQEQDLRVARRFFGFVLATLCLPGVSVNLVGVRVKANLILSASMSSVSWFQ